jgi:hypothetical protein
MFLTRKIPEHASRAYSLPEAAAAAAAAVEAVVAEAVEAVVAVEDASLEAAVGVAVAAAVCHGELAGGARSEHALTGSTLIHLNYLTTASKGRIHRPTAATMTTP